MKAEADLDVEAAELIDRQDVASSSSRYQRNVIASSSSNNEKVIELVSMLKRPSSSEGSDTFCIFCDTSYSSKNLEKRVNPFSRRICNL